MDASKTMWKLDLVCELRAVKSPQEKTEGGKEKQRAEEAEQKAPDVQKESRQKTRGVDRTEAAVKNLTAMKEMWIQSLGQEDPLEKEIATHSSILAWKSHGQRSLVGYSP